MAITNREVSVLARLKIRLKRRNQLSDSIAVIFSGGTGIPKKWSSIEKEGK